MDLRFRYNQDFDSVNSLVPATIAVLLALIPAILMALAVVREKEFGSITNLYVTPVTRAEFILGKQIPYVVLAMAGFAIAQAPKRLAPSSRGIRTPAALPSGKKRMARITLDYVMWRSTLEIFGGPDVYQVDSVTLVGVHPGNEELDFPASTEQTLGETVPGQASQKVTVRISYMVPID